MLEKGEIPAIVFGIIFAMLFILGAASPFPAGILILNIETIPDALQLSGGQQMRYFCSSRGVRAGPIRKRTGRCAAVHRGPEASASRSPRISQGARASVGLRSVGKLALELGEQ